MTRDPETLRRLEATAQFSVENWTQLMNEAQRRRDSEVSLDEVRSAEDDFKKAKENLERAESVLRRATTERELAELRESRGPRDPTRGPDRER